MAAIHYALILSFCLFEFCFQQSKYMSSSMMNLVGQIIKGNNNKYFIVFLLLFVKCYIHTPYICRLIVTSKIENETKSTKTHLYFSTNLKKVNFTCLLFSRKLILLELSWCWCGVEWSDLKWEKKTWMIEKIGKNVVFSLLICFFVGLDE